MSQRSEGFLPDDLVLEVLGQLKVPQIIRMRRVSRHLRILTYERALWADVYRRSNLLLAPGPSSSQSSEELEGILVQAAKLDTAWKSFSHPGSAQCRRLEPGFRIGSRTELHPKAITLVIGRFLLVCERSSGIRCYDLDSDTWDTPAATYIQPDIGGGMGGFMSIQHQVDLDVESEAFVCFAQSSISMIILKLTFPPKQLSFKFLRKVSAFPAIVYVDQMKANFGFYKPADSQRLIHLPSGTEIRMPNTSLVQMVWSVSSSSTQVELFLLPDTAALSVSPPPVLTRSHIGTAPFTITGYIEEVAALPSCDANIEVLHLFWVRSSHPTSTSALLLLKLHLLSDGTTRIEEATTPVHIEGHHFGIQTTSSRGIMRTIVRAGASGPLIAVSADVGEDNNPAQLEARALDMPVIASSPPPEISFMQGFAFPAFDGFRGRICYNELEDSGWCVKVVDCV
ncbi:hypothetical protein C8J57DRAFT_142030 [Mycena rebaudengoi]|nr:hypothetical protein C8J57DRAFT_142030 [Mycena rebaudengoi]